MSWTDKNHPLILITLSAKAAQVFSQLIRRGANKEQETAIGEIESLQPFGGSERNLMQPCMV